MRGDKLIIEDYHRKAAQIIVEDIASEINSLSRGYVISIAGESGSGKSEMAHAIKNACEPKGIKSVVLAQDDYFILPPKSNAKRRREDPHWLGPHVEVKMNDLEQNLIDALTGADRIEKPLVDYQKNIILNERIDLSGVKLILVEGTYASLLRNVDKRIFIDRDYHGTLAHRRKRNRGNEVNDPFVEGILETEHKIIAGHKQLANIVITDEYDVLFTVQVL